MVTSIAIMSAVEMLIHPVRSSITHLTPIYFITISTMSIVIYLISATIYINDIVRNTLRRIMFAPNMLWGWINPR